LVFIGRDYDAKSLRGDLESTLLTDEEMDDDWDRYPDPFGTEGQRELALADD